MKELGVVAGAAGLALLASLKASFWWIVLLVLALFVACILYFWLECFLAERRVRRGRQEELKRLRRETETELEAIARGERDAEILAHYVGKDYARRAKN